MSTVMDHPFFALAMSLRPKEVTDTIGGGVEASAEPHDTPKTPGPETMEPPTPPSPIPDVKPTAAPPRTTSHSPRAARFIMSDEQRRRKCPYCSKCPHCSTSANYNFSETGPKTQLASGYHGWSSSKDGDPSQPAKAGQSQSTTVNRAKPAPDGQEAVLKEFVQNITAAVTETPVVTFSDEMLQEIDTDLRETQVLILSPTRDLALYIASILAPRIEPLHITCYASVGGTVVRVDKMNLETGPHIVTGTLGRVADMMTRRVLRPQHIKTLVLNREDELLNRSSREQLFNVHKFLSPETKIVRAAVRVPVAEAVEGAVGGGEGAAPGVV